MRLCKNGLVREVTSQAEIDRLTKSGYQPEKPEKPAKKPPRQEERPDD